MILPSSFGKWAVKSKVNQKWKKETSPKTPKSLQPETGLKVQGTVPPPLSDYPKAAEFVNIYF